MQTTTEVSFVQDDHVVEEFAADRSDHALGERVLPGRTGRRKNFGDADATNPSPKLAAVDAVAIAEEVTRPCWLLSRSIQPHMCQATLR